MQNYPHFAITFVKNYPHFTITFVKNYPHFRIFIVKSYTFVGVLQRKIISQLENWAALADRKPLLLRGARQVGKTTVVEQFATQFDQYININLERKAEKETFENYSTIEELVRQLFFIKQKLYSKKEKTLLFIDEIQEVPEALNLLRYFYEDTPEIFVIAAGSLLEFVFRKDINIPVGRVENLVLNPFSFEEFLMALKDETALQQLRQMPISNFAHERMLQLFHKYILIGGMPEVVKKYIQQEDLKLLDKAYENLLTGYLEDVKKYAESNVQAQIIRNVMRNSFEQAGQRITYVGFGNSNYNSKEVKSALSLLEDARLLHVVYPLTTTTRPIEWNYKKKPRLHLLDIGLVNYFKGIQKEIMLATDLEKVYKGSIIEQIVGQEMIAYQTSILYKPNFWVREKNESSAEIDYLYIDGEKIIPIEVKAGATGKLKSLHIFMDTASHTMAVRVYGGKLEISTCKTISNKTYFLLNLPYYLIAELQNYLAWFESEIEKLKVN